MAWFLENLGLILNLVGSLMIAFSVRAHPYDAHVMHHGKKWRMACVSSALLFWSGVGTVIAGFAFALVYSWATAQCAS